MTDLPAPNPALNFSDEIIAAASCGILVYAESGQCLQANLAAAEIMGTTPENILRQNFRQLESWRLSGMLAMADLALATGEKQKGEFDSVSTCGEVRWISCKFSVFLKADKRYLLLATSDNTKRVEAEKATEKTKQFLQQVINAVADPIFVKDRQHRYALLNDAACAFTGRPAAALIGHTTFDIFSPAEAKILCDADDKFFQNRTENVNQHVLSDGQGRVHHNVTKKTFYKDEFGNEFIVGVVRDISEQLQMEAALRESKALYESLVSELPCGIFRKNALGQYVYVNDWFCQHNELSENQIVGYTPADVGAKLLAQVDTSLSEEMTRQRLNLSNQGTANHEHIMQTGENILVDEVLTLKDGSLKYFHVIKSPVIDADGKIIGSQGIQFDITQRKQTEEQLRKLSRAVEQCPVSVVITDRKGNMEYVNPKFLQVTGYALGEVIGQNPRMLKSGDSDYNRESVYKKLWATILSGLEWHGEFHNKKKNGELYWESVSISPITDAGGQTTHFVAVKEDITRQKQLEGEFRQAQKMEAFGSLAAGVAHDFNNMLTAILCNVQLIQDDENLDAPQKEALTEINNAAERAANLTRQLLLFSRQKPMQTKLVEVNDVVENMSKMFRRLIGEHIQLKTTYWWADTPVRADAGMLEQVLLNLVVNSRDAMPKGGELNIRTEALTITEATGRRKVGQYIRFSVSDTGFGISAHDMEHIFEPFFTTKEVGKGTGLGLATVFGIIEQHKGWIEVESEIGKGTTFHIYLPRHEASSDTDFIHSTKAPEPQGTETILLVEDELTVRNLARTILKRRGYRVLEADSGQAALEIWKRHRADIALLFTDMVMPGQMSGLELSRLLLKDKPSLKVVYTSGYTDEMLDEGSALRHTPNFLEKPYVPDVLLRKIRAAFEW